MKRYFFILFLVLILFIYNIVLNIKNNAITNHKIEKTDDIYLKYKATYNMHKEFSDIVFNALIKRDDILNAFEQKDREKLKSLLNSDYVKLRKFNVKQLHFHLVNNESFLRMHSPDKYGDNLSDIRPTIKYVNQYKMPIDGFENGKMFNGFRYVYPVFNKQNKHIGSVEISFGALLFVKELNKNYRMKCVLYINKNVVNKKDEYEKSIFDNFLIEKSISKYIKEINLKSNKIDTKLLKEINKELNNKKDFSIYNKDELITFILLNNPVTNKNIGFLSITTKDDYIIQKNKNMFIIISLLFVIMIIVLIIFYKGLKSKQDIKNDLKLKTHKNKVLKDLSKKLKDNLQIYSDHIIYSKTDLDGNIIEVSDAFCKISQFSKEELIGKKHNIIKSKNMDSKIYEQLWETITSNETFKGEIQNISKNGNIYWISTIIYPEYDSSGQKVGYISIGHNITNTKKVQFQHKILMQTEKLASMGEMITNISHQWRQPLSVISTSATGILMQNDMGIINSEFLTKACNNINNNAQMLSKTIDDFRNYSSTEEEILKNKLSEIINKFENLIQYTIESDNIIYKNNIESNIEIECSANSMIQALINLFNNTKDAFDDNNIENKIFIISAIKIENKVEITIQDSAGGIPDDIINKVFEPYFTTKHQAQGTGLGLHMCYNLIVDNMKGNIEVSNKEFEFENQTYKGACFKITI